MVSDTECGMVGRSRSGSGMVGRHWGNPQWHIYVCTRKP